MDKVKKKMFKYEKTAAIFLLVSTVLTTSKQTYGYKSKLSSYCQEKEFKKGIFQLA